MYSKQVVKETSELFGRRTVLQQLGAGYKLPVAFFLGCLFGLSCPSFDLWWIAWFGLAPLLVLLRGCNYKVEAALTGLCFGVGYNCVALSWYLGLAPLTWLGVHEIFGTQLSLLVWLVESAHQALLTAVFALLLFCLPMRPGFLPSYKRPFYPYLVSVPLLWLFLQWTVAPSELFIGIPINQLAYSQYKQLPIIQIASIGGSGCLDFLIVLFNACLANIFLEFSRTARRFGERTDQFSTRFGCLFDISLVAIVIVCIYTWGTMRVAAINQRTDPSLALSFDPQSVPVPLAVVQGNVTIEEEKLHISKPNEIAKRYASLCANLGASILCLPEGAINASQMQPGNLLSILKGIALHQKKEILVGSVETLKNGLGNAARIISPNQNPNSLYLKQRLVPLGELALPLIIDQHIPAPLREQIPATRESFLSAQSAHLVKSQWGNVGFSIYIELIYPKLIADEVRSGASLLVNVSNLAWFHGSTINRQMLAVAALRAVENERFVVLAANTGISAVVDPTGMINSMSLPGQRGVLLNTIQFLYSKTPFSKMWWM